MRPALDDIEVYPAFGVHRVFHVQSELHQVYGIVQQPVAKLAILISQVNSPAGAVCAVRRPADIGIVQWSTETRCYNQRFHVQVSYAVYALK